MKKAKVSEATGMTLDWMVTSIEEPKAMEYGVADWREQRRGMVKHGEYLYRWSSSWMQGGPIIEREEIFLAKSVLGGWTAAIYPDDICCILYAGDTPLTAAMRVHVASRYGDEVEVPDELV